MDRQDIERLTEIEQRSKSNTKRLNDHDERIEKLEKNTAILEKMDYRMGNVEKTVDKITCIGTDGKINFKYNAITSLTDFKTWLSNNNVKAYYEQLTPQTINLGKTNIELFNGTNILELENDLDNIVGLTFRKND